MRVQPVAAHLARRHPLGIVGVDLRDDELPAAERLALGVHGRAELFGDVHRAQVHDPVHRVEAKPVEVILRHPVHRVVHHVAADLVAVRAVQVEALTPGGAIPVREVGAELAEVVPLGTEMVVHHVEEHREAEPDGPRPPGA